MIPSKYVVALIQVVTIIVTSLIAANADNTVSLVEVLQIAAIVVGAIITYWAKLLEKGWAAGLKFAGAVLGAAIAAAIPIVDVANGGPGWTASAALIVLLAALNAALTAWGVDLRLDEVKAQLADPSVDNAKVRAADAPAYAIVMRA